MVTCEQFQWSKGEFYRSSDSKCTHLRTFGEKTMGLRKEEKGMKGLQKTGWRPF